MREVFEYYLKNCNQAIIHRNELFFEFGNYSVIYSFEKNAEKSDIDDEDFYDEDFFSFNSLNDIKAIDDLLGMEIHFTAFRIRGYEYLGWREDDEKGRSITNEMYHFSKKLKKFNQKCVIDNYILFDNGGDDLGVCDIELNYCFEVKISEFFFANKELATYVYKLVNSFNENIPDFYAIFFRNKIPIKDKKVVPILSTNTKVRRLGYFKILSLFLEKNMKVPVGSINKKFEIFCLQYQELLKDNHFNKGLISDTKSGISAKPYIDTANDLGFLYKINTIFYTGKLFKVYQTLQKELDDTSNIFELSDFDRIYFLETILRNDYFYFSNLLEILFLEEEVTYSDLVNKFQNQIIKCLEDYKNANTFSDRKILNNLDIILSRIKKWKKAEVYLEHILMPRLNWMLDLNLISGINNEYSITKNGLKLFQNLCIWNDINTHKIISPDAFLDRFMIHMYDYCYNNDDVKNPSNINLIIEKMYQYIDDSFKLFKTLAPNRVTASQSVNYTKYKLYLNNKIKVGYQFVLGKLSEDNQDNFIFKYQEQYQDGYIQKKN